jgi:hypothetical protein
MKDTQGRLAELVAAGRLSLAEMVAAMGWLSLAEMVAMGWLSQETVDRGAALDVAYSRLRAELTRTLESWAERLNQPQTLLASDWVPAEMLSDVNAVLASFPDFAAAGPVPTLLVHQVNSMGTVSGFRVFARSVLGALTTLADQLGKELAVADPKLKSLT